MLNPKDDNYLPFSLYENVKNVKLLTHVGRRTQTVED